MAVSQRLIKREFSEANNSSRDESVLPLFLGNTLLMKMFTLLAIYALMLVLMHPAGFNQSIQSMIIVFGLASSLNALDSTVYNYFQAKQQMYYAAIYQFLSMFLLGP